MVFLERPDLQFMKVSIFLFFCLMLSMPCYGQGSEGAKVASHASNIGNGGRFVKPVNQLLKETLLKEHARKAGIAANPQRMSQDFETFWEMFSETCYSNHNIDQLIYDGAPIVMDFVHQECKLMRKYNIGVICGFHDKTDHFAYISNKGKVGGKQPATKEMKLFAEKKPVQGFCEPSTSPDGIYIETNPKIEYWDDELGDMRSLKKPAKYSNAPTKKVTILNEHWIEKKMYFIQTDGQWWLYLTDDCDCSA